MKICSMCEKELPVARFDKRKESPDGLRQNCKDCKRKYVQRFKNENPEHYKIVKLRGGAKEKGIPFNIDESDINIPEKCPVLGISIRMNEVNCAANSPSVDRIIPAVGYIKGNVRVISHRANTLKSDATFKEIELIYLDAMRLKLRNELLDNDERERLSRIVSAMNEEPAKTKPALSRRL